MVAISHDRQNTGVNMRKSHEKVARAFLAQKSAHSCNVASDGRELRLFGNVVAKIEGGSRVFLTWAGWPTRTTAAVLNAIAECDRAVMRFHLDKGEPMARNIDSDTVWRVDSRQWLELV